MTEPSTDFTTRSLQLAREMMRDAELMLEQGGFRTAADRAYYAMFHAARAVLYSADLDLPKTHVGLQHLFGQHFILTGKLPEELGRSLRRAFRLRQQSDYEVHASVEEAIVSETIELAINFIETTAKFLGHGHAPD